ESNSKDVEASVTVNSFIIGGETQASLEASSLPDEPMFQAQAEG
ncbi:hypothetical protein Tco_1331898, partial [Tanacetum coccineum]